MSLLETLTKLSQPTQITLIICLTILAAIAMILEPSSAIYIPRMVCIGLCPTIFMGSLSVYKEVTKNITKGSK